MSFTEGDKAEIKLMAIEAAKEINREVMNAHIAGCSVGKELNIVIARWTGAISVLGGIVSIISVISLVVGIIVAVKQFCGV